MVRLRSNSPTPRSMGITGVFAFQPAGVDVKRTKQTAAVDASIGRIAPIRSSPVERPQSDVQRLSQTGVAKSSRQRARLFDLGQGAALP
jgi:hypothetical protein